MTTSDIIAICNIIVTVLAVLAAPVVALWISGNLQRKENARQDQLRLLGVLLSLRHQPLSPENFRALNLINSVFVNQTHVREAWSKYYSALSDQALNDGPGFSIREEKRRDLMIAIINVLGLERKITTSDLLRTYTPTAIIETEYLAIWERIKRREDLRAEFIKRGIGFPDFVAPRYSSPAKAAEPSTPERPENATR